MSRHHEVRQEKGYVMKVGGAPSRTLDRGIRCLKCKACKVEMVERDTDVPPKCDLCGGKTEYYVAPGAPVWHENFEDQVEREQGHKPGYRGRDKFFRELPKD